MLNRVPLRSRAFALGTIASLCLGAAALRYYRPSIPAAQAANDLDLPYYGNDPANTRYQNADQINPANVAGLTPAWIFHTGVHDKKASMETSPLVVGGTLYVTTGEDDVRAEWGDRQPEVGLPPRGHAAIFATGPLLLPKQPWRRVRQWAAVSGQSRRYLSGDRCRRGNPAMARAVVDNYQDGYSITMAPQYINGLVIVGVSGGEYLARGHVDAYNANTGALVWRFYTTRPGIWADNSWKTGGAPVWQTPAFDSSLGMLYFSTGNAAPDINGINRAGTNLYSASIVALDIASGQLRWYFQEVHHDIWDYDSTPPVVLFSFNGTPALAHSGKSGYFFILNRTNGTPLYQVTETPVPTMPSWQNAWPTQPESIIESLTPHSVSSVPPGYTAAPQWTPPQQTPYVMQPGSEGGSEWPPFAFSPRTNYVYQHARYVPQQYQTSPGNTIGGTLPGWGSTTDDVPNIGEYGLYGAIDTTTGKIAWKIKTADPADSGFVIAGDLAFFGENSGLFHAVNAATGQMLWTFDASTVKGAGGATAAPIAYRIHGREFIANAFGGNPNEASPLGDALIAFALPQRDN